MHPVGLVVVVAVLVVGTAVGLWRRRTDGQLRPVGRSIASASGTASESSLGSAGWAASVGGVGSARPGASGQPVTSASSIDQAEPGGSSNSVVPDAEEVPGVIAGGGQAGDPSAAGQRLDADLLAALGVRTGPVTLLQFSSAFCAPCRAVRRVSSEVAGMLPGVEHVEVDAESHLDAVRALGIWRTPTLLVLDSDGRVVKRATGVPAKAQLIAVLGELLPAA
jgi:thiol-disulfide isomerase/thioredoxin